MSINTHDPEFTSLLLGLRPECPDTGREERLHGISALKEVVMWNYEWLVNLLMAGTMETRDLQPRSEMQGLIEEIAQAS